MEEENATTIVSNSSPLSFVLHESASGYALFDIVEMERIGANLSQTCADFALFGQHVKLKAFQPFLNAENALENMNAVSEGIVTEDLINFLKMNCPKSTKKYTLGVSDKGLATALITAHKMQCQSGDAAMMEISRGIRMFFRKFVAALDNGGIEKAQLGLGHAYSRAKVKFNVNRADNMIIQAIALIDQLDKDVNTFAMRVREWYSWHFPELLQFVNDNYVYARCASFIKHRASLEEDETKLAGLAEIVMDEDKANQIFAASKISMGMDMSDIDMINIENFTSRLIKLAEYRIQLSGYLKSRMSSVAPNLGALIGDTVAARLISHAGSLTNLAKAPASTVQILGAEKALFRALKTRGNTPKYGLIFHSSFIGRAGAKNKGRISRYLANKCSIASRVDAFIDVPTTKYGDMMKTQVEERLAFYESGTAPRKNLDVMKEVADGLKNDAMDTEEVTEKSSKKRKNVEEVTEEAVEAPKSSKKSKKSKKTAESVVAEEVVEAVVEEAVEAPKSSKKSKKSKKVEEVVVEEEKVEAVAPVTPKSSKKSKKSKKVVEVAAPVVEAQVEEPVAVKSDKKKKKKKTKAE